MVTSLSIHPFSYQGLVFSFKKRRLFQISLSPAMLSRFSWWILKVSLGHMRSVNPSSGYFHTSTLSFFMRALQHFLEHLCSITGNLAASQQIEGSIFHPGLELISSSLLQSSAFTRAPNTCRRNGNLQK